MNKRVVDKRRDNNKTNGRNTQTIRSPKMNEEMFKAIIELVRSGGSAAVWIAVLHYAVCIIKLGMGVGLILYCVHKVYDLIKHGVDWSSEEQEKRMRLALRKELDK